MFDAAESGMKALPEMTRAKSLVGSLFAVALTAWTMTITPSANAILYHVSRSWSDDSGVTAFLMGTVDVPLGSYTIMDQGPSPFTSVSLTMILNGRAPFHLDHADTSLILGGQFLIFATASSLIFDAVTNGDNAADLAFEDATNVDSYAIGSDLDPHFQAAIVENPFEIVVDSRLSFPNVFGTARVPDTGSTLAMLSISLLGLGLGFKRLSRGSTTLTG